MEQDMEACCSAEESFTANYKTMMTLGKGQFSEVKLALHIPTLTCVAVKILSNEKYDSLIKSEITIMKSLDHPNIIKLFHVVQTRETTYLVMEHASQGDLFHHILELGSLEESKAQRLFTQILHAVQYCHNHWIIHKDIKANNVLLDHRGNAKLCDFGISAKVIPGQKLSGFCGTLNYCAPELFGKEAYDGRATDIWSLGVLLFFMVTGQFPFKAFSPVRVIQKIRTANFRVPPHVSVDIRELILEMMNIIPYRRPTIGQIMRHPMVRSSEAHSPPTSTQSLQGTPSPSIVRAMTVMGYKSEEIIESLRDQKYNQVMATYLILQHQSPGGDCYYHQEKQPGLILNLADRHTFPVTIERTTKPALHTFTFPSNTKEKDEENTRQCDTRHNMPATMCCQPKRILSPHPPNVGCPVTNILTGSNLEISENFTHSNSKIGSFGSRMARVQPPLLQDTSSPRPHQSETRYDTDNMSSCSSQEEFWSSFEEASEYFTPTGFSPWDTLQEETITQGTPITQEIPLTQDDTINHEGPMNQNETIFHEGTMTQDEAIAHEGTMSQDDAINHEATTTQEGTKIQEKNKTQEMALIQEGTKMQDMAIKYEATMTQEGTVAKNETINYEATMTQDDGINYEGTMTQEGIKNQEETKTQEGIMTQEMALIQEGTKVQDMAITYDATMTQEGTVANNETINYEATMNQDDGINYEGTMTQEGIKNQDNAITYELAITQEETMTQDEAIMEVEAIIKGPIITPEASMTQIKTIMQEEAMTLEVAMTQEETITHGQPQDAGPASSQTRRRHRWKGIKKTIINCFRHLCCCCCLPLAERGHACCKNLAPKKRDHGVTPRTSPEEVKPQLHGL